MDWQQTAFVFPGQGSQVVGMGRDVAAAYPEAQRTFEEADDILGFALSDMCFHGPAEQLDQTINTQPAIYVCSMAILRALHTRQPDAVPGFLAGHSLGEFTALTAAGTLRFAEGVRLVRERGRLMQEAGQRQPGAMAALLGLDAAAVADVCRQASASTGQPVVIANDNCPGQVVISGAVKALELALELAREAGARRAIRLAVSIAAHSPLMESAAAAFRDALAAATLCDPETPVYTNASATARTDAATIRAELYRQLTQPVRWSESVTAMIDAGATSFIEIGPGDVLTGLLRRIDRSRSGSALNNADALRELSGPA